MAILNYTTTISVEKTASEISMLLAKAKASTVLTEYDDKVLSAVSFKIPTGCGIMSFRLPANIHRIYVAIARDMKIPAKLRTKEQAARVAWRIVKDWLEAQLAIVAAGIAVVEQVFLPYAQNQQGQTVYEALKAGSFSGLALPSPTPPVN
jgi:hypothetical protein